MYDAPQCKVLIAGQSYMKCMELKRMLNWAEEGFRVILEQNISSCETPLERVNPDILILVGITGWMDVKVIIDSFAKKHNLSQIIVVCDEKNPLGLAEAPTEPRHHKFLLTGRQPPIADAEQPPHPANAVLQL